MKNIEEKKKEFLNKFAVNATETFFGNKEQLAKDGWEVGGTMEWIWKSSTDADRVWEYVQALLEEAQREAVKKLANDIKLEITEELNRSIKADSSATAVILEVDKAINRVLRNSEEKPSTGEKEEFEGECLVCGVKTNLFCKSCEHTWGERNPNYYCDEHYKSVVMTGNCCSENEKNYI